MSLRHLGATSGTSTARRSALMTYYLQALEALSEPQDGQSIPTASAQTDCLSCALRISRSNTCIINRYLALVSGTAADAGSRNGEGKRENGNRNINATRCSPCSQTAGVFDSIFDSTCSFRPSTCWSSRCRARRPPSRRRLSSSESQDSFPLVLKSFDSSDLFHSAFLQSFLDKKALKPLCRPSRFFYPVLPKDNFEEFYNQVF